MTDLGLRTVAAVAAVIAAMAGLLNTYQLATLTGTVAEIGRKPDGAPERARHSQRLRCHDALRTSRPVATRRRPGVFRARRQARHRPDRRDLRAPA